MDTQGYKANEVCTEPFALLLYWKLGKSYHLGLKRQKKKVARCLTALPILQSEAYIKPWENINLGMYTWKKKFCPDLAWGRTYGKYQHLGYLGPTIPFLGFRFRL